MLFSHFLGRSMHVDYLKACLSLLWITTKPYLVSNMPRGYYVLNLQMNRI